jgi:hypothetical protein
LTGDAMLREAMRCMFQRRNVREDIVEDLLAYWEKEPTLREDGTPQAIPDFTSLEDFGAEFHIPGDQLHQLRHVMTAQKPKLLPRININTAPQEVLAAVLFADKPQCEPDSGIIDQITQRQADPDQPFTSTSHQQTPSRGRTRR